jgi:hypothetical protein
VSVTLLAMNVLLTSITNWKIKRIFFKQILPKWPYNNYNQGRAFARNVDVLLFFR